MTYDTEATQTPTPVNNNREQNKKTLKIIGAVVGVLILIGIASGGGSSSNNSSNNSNDNSSSNYTPTPSAADLGSQWQDWKSVFMPVVQQTEADYNQTVADLQAGDYYAAKQDFATLSGDSGDWYTYDFSPNATVNAGVRAVAEDLQNIAYTGLMAMDGGSLSDFNSACEKFGADTDKLAVDIENANNSY